LRQIAPFEISHFMPLAKVRARKFDAHARTLDAILIAKGIAFKRGAFGAIRPSAIVISNEEKKDSSIEHSNERTCRLDRRSLSSIYFSDRYFHPCRAAAAAEIGGFEPKSTPSGCAPLPFSPCPSSTLCFSASFHPSKTRHTPATETRNFAIYRNAYSSELTILHFLYSFCSFFYHFIRDYYKLSEST